MRFAFAGDRDIAVRVLDFILQKGERPLALLVPEGASHAYELKQLLRDEGDIPVFHGRSFEEKLAELRGLQLDYIIAIHFPHLIPPEVLQMPRVGAVNLHPAYLPFNRGWHTPSWAILDETPVGATLHFMDEGLDTGDIIRQKRIDVRPHDTADSLYRRLKDLEFDVFREAWPELVSGSPTRSAQKGEGTSHSKKDLFRPDVQQIDLDASMRAGDLLRKLRALTTNRPDEAAYFEQNGTRFRIRVEIEED